MQLRRRVLLKMIESRHMPIGKELEANLGDAVGLYNYWVVLKLSGNERSGSETNIAEKIVLEYALFPHSLPPVVLPEPKKRGEPYRPVTDTHCPPLPPIFPQSFHSTSDTCAAARHNLVTAGVEDLKRNCIGELIAVVTDVDGAGESVCLYPDPGGTKNEDLGYCAIRVALGVLPDTQSGSGCRGELACGRVGERTPFGEGKQCREGPQHLSRLTVLDRELYAPRPFEAVGRPSVHRLSRGC